MSFIGHLTRRVSIQEPARIRSQAHHVVPLLVEKLGDSKERNRSVAANTILETFKYAPQDVEKGLKEFGFSSKNQRVRLESTKLLQAIYAANPGFSFKGFTPFLMNLLEDPNEGVRETAKEVVVDLFRYGYSRLS